MNGTFKKTNFHTHTVFCDGKNTAEEMVQAALAKDFSVLGFSAHSMYPFASYHLVPKQHAVYCAEIRRLKQGYAGKIEILLGFEADFIEGFCAPRFDRYKDFAPDYLIGSVHYVPGSGGYFEADGAPDDVSERIRSYFGGNEKKAVQEYFACERQMLRKGDFTILGHPDLIRIQNSKRVLFDEEASWYKQELAALAKEIARSGVCVEINTGGMARGYLQQPYPSPYFLGLLHEAGVPVTICSDAHKVELLDFWFPEAVQYAKAAGYTELAFCGSGGLQFQNI